MALIVDPDQLSQGARTTESVDFTASSGTQTTLTGTGLPVVAASDYFEIRGSPIAGNNGLYQASGTPTTSSVTCDKVDGTNPTNDTTESVEWLGDTTTYKSVHFDTDQKRIYLLEQGNLSTDGVTGQALYSFAKEEWKDDVDLIQYEFPMVSVTPEQFEFVSGWVPQDVTSPAIQTRKLLRTAGWSEIDASSVLKAQYLGVITLGSFPEATDQPHYQLGNDPTDTTAAVDFTFADAVNEAIQTYDQNVGPGDIDFVDGGGGNDSIVSNDSDNFVTLGYKIGGSITVENAATSANDGTYEILAFSTTTTTNDTVEVATASLTADTTDAQARFARDDRSAVKVFIREPFTTNLNPDSGKTYDQSTLSAIGVTTVTNKVERFPLASVADLKVTNSDATISGNTPYTQIDIKYFDGVFSRDVDTATNRSFGIAIDVGTHSGIDGTFTSGMSVLTSTDGGIPTSTYDSGTLTILSGTDEGSSYTVSSTTATTVTISSTFNNTEGSGASFVLQRSTPVSATAEEIYEKVQYQLRQNADIDDSAGTVTGSTADALLAFVGDTLITQRAFNPNTAAQNGVSIEGFSANDTNRITFTDNAGATFTYPFVAAGAINFNSNLVNDSGPAEYTMFFTYTERFTNTGFGLSGFSGDTATLDSSVTDLTAELANGDYINLTGFTNGDLDGIYVLTGAPAGMGPYTAAVRRVDGSTLANEAAGASVSLDKNPINSPDAIIVDNNSGADITGTIGASSVNFDFDYDNNVQGGRTAATNAEVTVRAIGLDLGQFVETTGTITRATGLVFTLVSGLERNYNNP